MTIDKQIAVYKMYCKQEKIKPSNPKSLKAFLKMLDEIREGKR